MTGNPTQPPPSESPAPGGLSRAMDPLATLLGESVEVERTVTQSDVLAFAALSGDFAPQHVDEEYARRTGLGRCIAHGALLVGLASACSTKMAEKTPVQVVSLGYDRIRFIKPVFVGDTVRIRYSVTDFDPVKRRTTARIEFTNQGGQLVAVVTHLLQAYPGAGPANP
jgi:3-hydroxybutyryl-CoA dehydratase